MTNCGCLSLYGKTYERYLMDMLSPGKIPFFRSNSLRSCLMTRYWIRPLDYEVCNCKRYNPRGVGVTISPDPTTVTTDIQINKFIVAVHKLFKKTWIEKYYYTFETTQAGHIHVHAFIITNGYKPGKVKYEFARSLKLYVNSTKAILCKWSNFVNTYNYITKDNKKDINYRLKYNLDNIYTNHAL